MNRNAAVIGSPDPSWNLLVQYRRLLQAILCEALRSVADEPPGLRRIGLSLTAYLDASFARRRAINRLLGGLEDLPDTDALRSNAPLFLLRAELGKLGVPTPAATAGWLMARIDGLRDAECNAGRTLATRRAEVMDCIGHLRVGAAA